MKAQSPGTWIIVLIGSMVAVGTALSISQVVTQEIGQGTGSDFGCTSGTWNSTSTFQIQTNAGSDDACYTPTDLNHCCLDYNDTDAGGQGCCNSTGTRSQSSIALDQTQNSLSLGDPTTIIMAAGMLISVLLLMFRV